MRKIAAIFLMLILLFNLGGYRLVLSIMQQQSDNRLESLLDQNEYDESQLIEIKVAMNLPYQQRYTDFERHYGEIEIEGKVYSYVKMKVEGDYVIFKCIPNEQKQQLINIEDGLAKANSNVMDHSGQQKQHSVNFSLSDFDGQTCFAVLDANNYNQSEHLTGYSFSISTGVINTPHQPPELA